MRFCDLKTLIFRGLLRMLQNITRNHGFGVAFTHRSMYIGICQRETRTIKHQVKNESSHTGWNNRKINIMSNATAPIVNIKKSYEDAIDLLVADGYTMEEQPKHQKNDYDTVWFVDHRGGFSCIEIARKPNRVEIARVEYSLEQTQIGAKDMMDFTEITDSVRQLITRRVNK